MVKKNLKIYQLADANVAGPILVKLRTELINIERLSNRIAVIKHTSFIPAAYTIAELAAAGVIGGIAVRTTRPEW